MYLNLEDLKKGMYGEILNVITRNADNANQAISDAMAEAESYLCARYDMKTEFSKTGDQRSAMVVKIVRDIALYNCYNISNPVNMPESRRNTYKDSIAYLKEVQAERASIEGLVRLAGTSGTSSYVVFGGNKKRKNQY